MGLKFTLLISLIFSPALPIFSQGITVHTVRGLDFGTQIFPGIEKRVSRKDAGAAKYVVSGEAGKQVQILFQLPNNLTDPAGNSLNITFSSTAAGYSRDERGKFSAIAFDPRTGTVTTLNEEGKLYIWLGAAVTPLTSQPGNNYSGDLIIDVSYTN